MARAGAFLFGAAALVTALGLLLPHQRQVDELGLALVAVGAALVSAILGLARGRLPEAVSLLVPAAGTLLISLALLFNGERHGGAAGGDEMYYLWVVLYTAHYLGRRATVAHVSVIAVAYGVTLAAIDPGDIAVSRWLSTVGLMACTAVVIRLLTERAEKLLADLDSAARTDLLTALPNRRAFEEQFERESNRAERSGSPFALVLADVDRFKELNDRAGHLAGDAALVDLGRLFKQELRSIDFVGRIGGDEFALILPDADTDTATQTGLRLARIVRERAETAGSPIGLSFGVAIRGPDGRTLDELMRVADEALYAAKRRTSSRITAAM